MPSKQTALRLVVLTALIVLLVQGVVFTTPSLRFWEKQAPQNAPQAHAAHPLLSIALPDLAQQPQSLAQWSGHVLVLNFWATWCGPCKEEMPMLDALQQEWDSKGVRFVGIGIDEAENMKTWLKSRPMHYPQWVGNDQTLMLTAPYGNATQGVPFTAVFSAQGDLVAEKLGAITEKELSGIIANALK